MKKSSVQTVLDAANFAIQTLETNDEQVQATINASVALAPVTFPRILGDDLSSIPGTSGAVENDISYYIPNNSLLQLLRLESGTWEDFMPTIPLNTTREVASIDALKSKLPLYDEFTLSISYGFKKRDGLGGEYYWDEDSIICEDGINVVKSIVVGYTGVGRWHRVETISHELYKKNIPSPTYKTPYIISADDIELQDATLRTYKTKIFLPAGRIAVGAIIPNSDDNDDVDITVGATTKTRTFSKLGLSNLTSSYYESGEIFEIATAGVYDVELDGSGDATEFYGIIIRIADPFSGIVEDQGSYTHCNPVACVYDGKHYQLHKEIYSGDSYLSIDGEPWGRVFTGAFWNEKYHYGGAIFSHPNGIVVANCEHVRPIMEVKFAPLGNFDNLTSSYNPCQASASVTYCHGVSLDNGELLLLTRGYDVEDTYEVNNSALVYRIKDIENIDSGSPSTSHTVDLIAQETAYYPRRLFKTVDKNDEEIVCVAWGRRNVASSASGDLDWTGTAAAIFYPNRGSFGEWYSLKYVAANSNAALGTNQTPRFSTAQEGNFPTDAAGGIKCVDGAADTERYPFTGVIFEVDTFPSNAKLLTAFIDKVDEVADQGDDEAETNKFSPCTIRWMVQTASARYLSPGDFNSVHVASPNSYRVEGSMVWKDNDPTTDIAYLIISNRGTRTINNSLGEEVNIYYDWGATEFLVFEIDDPISTSPNFKLIDKIDFGGQFTTGFVAPVEGKANTFVLQRAINMIHGSHAQCETIIYEV
ncbi:MAG: hypothetical protein RLN90_09520 [Balneolaceae bacterium]